MEPTAAAALLEALADRALRSGSEPVLCLEAPEAAYPAFRANSAPARPTRGNHASSRVAPQENTRGRIHRRYPETAIARAVLTAAVLFMPGRRR
jgi:hypothetical protein